MKEKDQVKLVLFKNSHCFPSHRERRDIDNFTKKIGFWIIAYPIGVLLSGFLMLLLAKLFENAFQQGSPSRQPVQYNPRKQKRFFVVWWR